MISKKMSRAVAVIVIVIVVLAALGGVYYFAGRSKVPAPAVVEPPAGAAISNPTLGAELYEKSANPVADRLPETVAPVANPIEGAYKNPFE